MELKAVRPDSSRTTRQQALAVVTLIRVLPDSTVIDNPLEMRSYHRVPTRGSSAMKKICNSPHRVSVFAALLKMQDTSMWPSLISSDGALLDPPQICCLVHDFLVVFYGFSPLILLCSWLASAAWTNRVRNVSSTL